MKRDWLDVWAGLKTYNHLLRLLCWKQRESRQLNFTSINHLHSIQKKNNFSFSFHSIDFTCEIDWVELKRYYNSIIKVDGIEKNKENWWNDWINLICFLKMKSIFYAAAHSSLSLPPNHSLRMDGLVEKREEKKSLAAPSVCRVNELWMKRAIQFAKHEARRELVGFALLIVGGLRAAPQPLLRTRKKAKPKPTPPIQPNQAARNEKTINWAVRGKPTID